MSLSANHPIRTPQEILAANAHKRRNKTVGDRFIPSRSNMNIDAATYLLTNEISGLELDGLTASQASYRTQLAEACGIPLDQRILSFKQKAPGAPEGTGQQLAKKYGCSAPARTSHKLHRHIPESCERVLDAPDIVDDYYLNCLDWSSKDVLAVGLGSACYLWDASEGTTDLLMDMENDHYVSSVSWNGSGRYLAVGLSNATVRLFDPSRGDRPLRQLRGHADRVSSMSWNGSVLTTAGKDSVIINHDVRMRDHIVSTFQGHTQEVCGLKWSPDGQFLASGGNDNLLHIWNMTSSVDMGAPVHTFDEHQAAVKALAWSPHQSNLLASGGGTADGCIKFWNINKGSIVRSVDTGSQVCALLWNRHEKEILSCHGNNACSLTLWKYPTMTRIGEMKGHTQRPLHMAVNPAGTTVCSAGADETLRLWSAFNEAPTTCRTNASSAQLKESTHAFRSVCIR